jgi:hypothetical protein
MERFKHSLEPVDSIDTVDEMLIHSDTEVVDGERIWVRSVQAFFVYRRGSGLTPDGVSVVASTFGDGVWVRLAGSADLTWLTQPQWFINAVSGSDEASGADVSNPIKTWAELRRRIGRNNIQVACGIVLQTDLPAGDPMIVDFGCDAQLEIFGGGTLVRTSTITTFTARNPSTNAPATLDDGVFDWTTPGYTGPGYNLIIQSGPAAGSVAWIALDQGGGTARVSTFVDVAGSEKTPLNGNAYSVFRLTQVGAAYLDPPLAIGGPISFVNLLFPSGPPIALRGTPADSGEQFWFCSFGTTPVTAELHSATFISCRFQGAIVNCSQWELYGGLSAGGSMVFQNGGESSVYRGMLVEGGSYQVSQGAFVNFDDAGAMDFATQGFQFLKFGRGFGNTMWGTTAAGATAGCSIGVTSQLEGASAENRTVIGSGVNSNVIVGLAAAAAWPAGAGLTVNAASLAAYIHD